MLLSNLAVCHKKKSTFIKNQQFHKKIVLTKFKMNKVVNGFLLIRNKFITELHLGELELH